MAEKDKLNGALEGVSGKGGKTGKTARDESIASLYLSPEIKGRIRRYADEWGVSESAVARYALGLGFEAIEAGRKPKMVTKRTAVLE